MSEIELVEENMSEELSIPEIELVEEHMSEKKMAKGKMSGKKIEELAEENMSEIEMAGKKMPEDETSETKKAKKKMSWKGFAKGSMISWKRIAWRPEFKKNLPSFSAIVHVAESEAYKNEYRKVKWLFDSLKEVMYDRDDLQDEIATERLRRRLENKPQNIKTWLRELRSTTLIDRRWKEIVARIEYLRKQNKILELPFFPFEECSTMTYSTPAHARDYLVPVVKERFEDDFQVVFGRDEDQKAIMKLLLSDDVCADHTDVIPIVGLSGLGKTTLAGLVYKDYRVSKHFDLKGWVYVSDDFDVFQFTKTLLEVFTGQTSDITDRSDLQVKLKESLYLKKCLLVLDDVCCEDSSVLAMMCEPLIAGAKGSKIIVTTQSASVASKMGTRTAYCLDPLRGEDSWMLFAKHAFFDENIGSYRELEATGRQIVTKCDGLPLAIVTLGAMLRFDRTIQAWKAVLMKIPDSCTSDFIPVLLISYNSLPAHLKRCFAYCSIFPKDYEYEKEKLVLLWMAEGLLQHQVNGPREYCYDRRLQDRYRLEYGSIEEGRIEEGLMYFDDLTLRCFFQQSSANKSRFVMHPVMNDLARLVSGNFCSRLMNDKSQMVSPKVRHLSFSGDLNAERWKAICQETKLVRTLLPYKLPIAEQACHSSVLEDLFEALGHLRVLSFSHYHITELPDSMKKLKFLRYLDLSHTAISRLPDTVSTLHNLQTLLLSYCRSLAELPKNMGNLINLRHLDIRETYLEEMPAKMGFLTSLRSLSNFVVGKDSGSKIMELGRLSNLQGTLHISQLQNVVSAGDACEAKLKNKAGLQMLGLEWSDGTVRFQNQTEVLQQLEPHKNLEKLSIISYAGNSFPNWLGDSSFNLVFLHLSNCNSCPHLPPLGQLPSLKELKVERMNRVKSVDPEFYATNYSRGKPFPSLERLSFQEMLEWKEWTSPPTIEGEEFPSLKWIRISGCPKLAKDLHSCLPQSAKVEISDSPLLKVPVIDDSQLQDGVKMRFENEEMPAKMGFLPSLQSLPNFVVGKDSGSEIMELGPLSNLQGTLHISQLQNVESAGDACKAKLKNKAGLQMLGLEWSDGTVRSQKQTKVLQQLEPHKNLEKLSIISYGGKSFPNWLGDSSFNLVFLHLSNCNSCPHLPPLGQLPSLKELKVERMNRVKLVGPEFYATNYYRVKTFPSLERLSFQEMLEWKEWTSPRIKGEEFPSLKWIRISGCPKLAKDLQSCLPQSAKVEISDSPLLNVPARDDSEFGNDDKVAGRPPMHQLMKEKQLANEDEGSSQSLEHRTDVPATSQSSPPESSKLLTESAPSKLPVIAEKQLHEGHKSQFRRNEKLPDRPSSSREVESSQLVDSNEVQGTDVSMTAAATDRLSDTDTDDQINVLNDEEILDGISSPEQESLNVSEISQLKRLPPKLYDLKIEGSDALESLTEESMHKSRYLQRLYIIGCHFLKSIQARSLPNALKTLYISKCENLEFSSFKHASLEHLHIESSCDSLNSFPLDFFPKLRSLFIQGCANFNSISIGLKDHKYLDALEIRDCAQLESFPEGGLRIPNLTSILLSNCKNLKALPGQLHSLTSLQSLFINECPELESIPEGGLPSSLNLFCLRSCDKLTPRIEWGLHQLNNFSRIEIEGGCRHLESFPKKNLLPVKLNSLQISRFPNLKFLNYEVLQDLKSLQTLKINSCDKLQSLPEEGLPSSLSYLYISDCPLLKSKLSNNRGKEWYKIAHIPHIQIDGKVIS